MSLARALNPITRMGTLAFRQSPSKQFLAESIRRNCSSTSSFIFEVSDSREFSEHVVTRSNETPIVIDFYADWCGPCKILTPRLEEKIANRGGEILLAKVNVDDAGELAMDLQIAHLPTVIAMRNGEEIGKFVGANYSDDQLDDFIDKIIQGDNHVSI